MHNFLSTLKSKVDDSHLIDFCRKEVLHGCPFVFNGKEDDYYEFRKLIAAHFNVNFLDIYIVGSAKLGFSPHKETSFSLDSDIDVAIVSHSLFDEIMEGIYGYQMALRAGRSSVTQRELDKYHKFLEYVAIGWIRPDKLPHSFDIKAVQNDWFNFFRSISHGKSCIGNYSVKAGVFKSYDHLERYLISGYIQLRSVLMVKDSS